MNYRKPELVRLGDAASAIQNGIQKTSVHIDNCTTADNATGTAYEADE
jgi:hypothetical protein